MLSLDPSTAAVDAAVGRSSTPTTAELLVSAPNTGVRWSGLEGTVLLAIIVLAGLGTGVLFLASLIAYSRRRSSRYLLVVAAVGVLFLRSLVGFGTLLGITPMLVHHLVEHTFDFFIAALVLYAVYRSKPTRFDTAVERESD